MQLVQRRSRQWAGAIILMSLMAIVTPCGAAVITWNAPQNITGDSDVSTFGTLVGAANLGDVGVAATTVNGVTFNPLGVPKPSTIASSGVFQITAPVMAGGNGLVSPAAPFATLSPEYQTLLGSAVGGPQGATITLTLSGLAAGRSYQFQWWTSLVFAYGDTQYPPVTGTAGNSVDLLLNTTNADGGTGQFAIGTFIADGATQEIVFSSQYLPVINAMQLRDLSSSDPGPVGVPLPAAAWAALALLAPASAWARRMRK